VLAVIRWSSLASSAGLTGCGLECLLQLPSDSTANTMGLIASEILRSSLRRVCELSLRDRAV
jgi:hypothetical protein